MLNHDHDRTHTHPRTYVEVFLAFSELKFARRLSLAPASNHQFLPLVCCLLQAVLVWDLHCHLVTSEVVGLLAGTWNAEAGDVCIRAAYPCHTRTDATEGHSCSGLDLGSAAVDEVSVGL